MQTFLEGDIFTQGTRLHYYRTGGQKPPLVLIHGISDDGLCWTPFAQSLSDSYDAIMVDLRAHGKSEAPDQGYDYQTMAMEVAGLITELELGKPVVIGHSLGAMTSLILARLKPDLPAAILLEDPPAFWKTPQGSSDDIDRRAAMRIWFHELKRKTRDDLLELVKAEHPNWPQAEIEPWIDSKHRYSYKITKLVEPGKTLPADFPESLKQITCPALLITADPQLGAILADDDVAELQKWIPHLERAHIPGAGHSIRREQFSNYMEFVLNFLSEINF